MNMSSHDGEDQCHFIQISPPKRSGAGGNRKGHENELARPQYLILGTFTSTPKLHFERLQLGQSRSRVLIVRNPSPQDIWFRFLKMPSPVFEMSCDECNTIPAQGQLTITFKWTPTEVTRCFEALRCQSQLSGVALTIHLLGEAEPGPKYAKSRSSTGRGLSAFNFNTTKSTPAKSSSALDMSRILGIGTEKAHKLGCTAPVSRSVPSTSTVVASSSPSRRETYLVPATPNKVPLIHDISSAFTGLELNFDEDDVKENFPPKASSLTDLHFDDNETEFDDAATWHGDSYVDSDLGNMSSTSSASMAGKSGHNMGHYHHPADHVHSSATTPSTSRSRTYLSDTFMEFLNDPEDLEGELLDKACTQLDQMMSSCSKKFEK